MSQLPGPLGLAGERLGEDVGNLIIRTRMVEFYSLCEFFSRIRWCCWISIGFVLSWNPLLHSVSCLILISTTVRTTTSFLLTSPIRPISVHRIPLSHIVSFAPSVSVAYSASVGFFRDSQNVALPRLPVSQPLPVTCYLPPAACLSKRKEKREDTAV